MTFFDACHRHIVTGLEGPELNRPERALLLERPPAGIILFERNIESPAQVRGLTRELREILGGAAGPPLLMVDHEGGAVAHARRAAGVPPAALAFGAADANPDPGGEERVPAERLARDAALETGRRLRELGFNLVLAPVLDLVLDAESPVIGTRGFGGDPGRAGRLGAATIRGLHRAGLAACAKHFPGHGATRVDSHRALPVLEVSRDLLLGRELEPFRAAVREGVETVLVGHLALDGVGGPATLSPWAVRDLLRQELGYGGVVVTDALEMGALGGFGALPELFARALGAGCDLLLTGLPLGEVRRALGGPAEGRALEAPRSLARIGELRRCLGEAPSPSEDPGSGGDRAYDEVSRRSVVLVGDPGNLPTPGSETRHLIVADENGLSGVEEVCTRLAARLGRLGVGGRGVKAVETIRFGSGDAPSLAAARTRLGRLAAEPGESGGEGSGAARIVCLVSRGPVPVLDLVLDLCTAVPRSVLVGFGWPGLAAFTPEGLPVLLAWDHTEAGLGAAVAVLEGGIRPGTRLPFDFGPRRPAGARRATPPESG